MPLIFPKKSNRARIKNRTNNPKSTNNRSAQNKAKAAPQATSKLATTIKIISERRKPSADAPEMIITCRPNRKTDQDPFFSDTYIGDQPNKRKLGHHSNPFLSLGRKNNHSKNKKILIIIKKKKKNNHDKTNWTHTPLQYSIYCVIVIIIIYLFEPNNQRTNQPTNEQTNKPNPQPTYTISKNNCFRKYDEQK